ncbi:MAG: hypothetical protein JW867_05830 [Candidatus Omnitrophica bacterium]|nr:hypothetical protein [Candidatus Omnitrophota bacterium]
MLNSFVSKKILLTVLLILVSFNNLYAQRETYLFHKAVGEAKSGNRDFAFIYFRRFLQSEPDSNLAKEAVFALGEYYYSLKSFPNATLYFKRFITDYPKNDARIFAYAYLLDLAKADGKIELTAVLEKKIVTYYSLSLLFRKYKEYRYKSPMAKNYKALYYIDKVQIYLDEELFAEIPY